MSRRWRVDIPLGGALLLAFSPGLYDLFRHWLLHPWSRYSALFVLLVGWCLARERDAKPKRLVGAGLIAAGVVLQLLSVLSVMPAIARLAFVAAAIGFMLLRGLVTPRVAALAVFVVPVPHAFTSAVGGVLVAQELFRSAELLLQPFGVAVAAGQYQVLAGSTALEVNSTQAGLPTLVAMLGLAFYAVLRARPSARRAGLWLAALLSSGVIAQGLGIVLACLALASGSASAASFSLDTVGWLLPAVVVVWSLERYQRPQAGIDTLPL